MSRRPSRRLLAFAGSLLIASVTACTQLPTACEPCISGECPDHAKVCKHPTVHALACDLDHLERHIDCYGSVTAKIPDVWGQARLTQYREEFEQQMKKDVDGFELRLNGAMARADQSLFEFAQAINVAAAGKPAVPGRPGQEKEFVRSLDVFRAGSSLGINTSSDSDQKTTLLTDEENGLLLNLRQATTQTVGGFAGSKAISPDVVVPTQSDLKVDSPFAEKLTIRESVGLAKGIKDTGISLEPTLELAQKKRYLDFLNQLRRENEGSDTADAPGYQLNLMRIPVSVLPGSHTNRGHGAEITCSIDPVLGHDLLPTTFRRMVVNDLTRQFGLPIVEALESEKIRGLLNHELRTFVRNITRLNDYVCLDHPEETLILFVKQLPPAQFETMVKYSSKDLKLRLWQWRLMKYFDKLALCFKFVPKKNKDNSELKLLVSPRRNLENYFKKPQEVAIASKDRRGFVSLTNVSTPTLSFANGLDNKLPFPTTQMMDIYGEAAMFEIAYGAYDALAESIEYQHYAHLPDVQNFLKEESRAAYEFLAKNPHLFTTHCTMDLVQDIRSKRMECVYLKRQQFRRDVAMLTGSEHYPLQAEDFAREPQHLSMTASLAWCLIVDSALLNDRLIRDMQESATARGLSNPCQGNHWPQFYLPDPSDEDREAFKHYVRTRWPIYVFALDPMTQEQNLDDVLQTRRQTQLALSVAFASGRIGSRLFTRYARQLDAQYQTIALNRTQIGFASGENTFGWRFYPRFQTPPTQSNLTVLLRDQLIGGPTPNALMRQQRLEPGPRECVALVIMPSFVPYVNVEVSSNWFCLANPKRKLFDHTQAMKLSKVVKTLERCEPNIQDADCYRDGELQRLQNRVRQLANRLPAQSLTVPVPIVNTLGGFEMFSNGTTDLAPELYGWYGAPGVSTDRDTTVFLVGDHFSPLHSRVIIGNAAIETDGSKPQQRMLSRQVMQVTIRKDAIIPLKYDDETYVLAHVATPYGVSRELYIPVISEKKPEATDGQKAGYTLPEKTALTIAYGVKGMDTKPGHFKPVFHGVSPKELEFTWFNPLGTAPTDVTVKFIFEMNGVTLTVPCRSKANATTNGRPKVVLSEEETKKVAADLLRQLAELGPFPLNDNPLDAGLKTKSVLVTPVMQGKNEIQNPGQSHTHTTTEVKANGQLTVIFKSEGFCTAPVPVP